MAVRLSTQTLQQRGINSILDQQSKLSHTQMQLSTGRRILQPSDDPVASEQVMELNRTLSRIEAYDRNMDRAETKQELEEDVLNSVQGQLQRARELGIQAINATQTDESRKHLAEEVTQIFDELVNLANTTDGSGEYLFAGYKSEAKPFTVDAGDTVSYHGDQGQRDLKIGEDRTIQIGDSGDRVFRQIRDGNGTFAVEADAANTGNGTIDVGTVTDSTAWVKDDYTIAIFEDSSGDMYYNIKDAAGTDVAPDDTTGEEADTVIPGETVYPFEDGKAIAFRGVETAIHNEPADGDQFYINQSRNQDLFTAVRELRDAMESGTSSDASKAQFLNSMNQAITDIDQGMERILEVRAEVGGRLNALDDQRNTNEVQVLSTKEIISSLEDLDYAEAISRMNLQMAGLQAAQKSYQRVQNLSMFNYI